MSRCGAVMRAVLLPLAVVAVLGGCSAPVEPAPREAGGTSGTPVPSGPASASATGSTDPAGPDGSPSTESPSTESPSGRGGDGPGTPGTVSSADVRAAVDCLDGRWTMASFAVEAEKSVTTSGDGGDVVFSFEEDRWQLWGRGVEPVTVSIGSRTAELSVDGWAKGRMSVQPGGVRYQLVESSGDVQMGVPGGSEEHPIPLKHFLGTMVPAGPAGIECSADEARISSLNVSVNQVLTLRR